MTNTKISLEISRCGGQLSVTASALDMNGDVDVHVIQPEPISVTCTFKRGEVAVVRVYGASNEEEAVRVVAQQAFPHCLYSAVPGDPTRNCAEPFYLWVCNQDDQGRAKVQSKEGQP